MNDRSPVEPCQPDSQEERNERRGSRERVQAGRSKKRYGNRRVGRHRKRSRFSAISAKLVPRGVEHQQTFAAPDGQDGEPDRRSATRFRPVVLAVAITSGFVLIAVWQILAAHSAAAERLRFAEALLQQAAGTIGALDETVTAQLSPDAVPTTADISAERIVVDRELERASQLLDDVGFYLSEEQREHTQALKTIARAQRAMINAAPTVLAVSTKAVRAKTLGDQAWRQVRLASRTETAAVDDYEEQSASKVKRASVATRVEQERLKNARRLYSRAASAFPDADFRQFVRFVDAKTYEAKLLGKAADQWLDGDRSQAHHTYRRYRAAAAKSSRMAASLPTATGYVTGSAFREVAGVSADAYLKARQQLANSGMLSDP